MHLNTQNVTRHHETRHLVITNKDSHDFIEDVTLSTNQDV